MKTCLPISLGPPQAEPEDLLLLIETDQRRSRIGVHVASDMTRPAHFGASVWLDPDRAERLAQDLLAAVSSWRADQAVIAWTAQTKGAPQ